MPGEAPPLEDIRGSFAPVLEEGGAKRAIIFGSYTRGNAGEYGDMDLLIIKETLSHGEFCIGAAESGC